MEKMLVFGHIPGVAIGTIFANRAEVKAAGLHRDRMAGISGVAQWGADAIVISGGYEDDTDHGEEIIYTGHGGNSPETKRQIANQRLERGNLALTRNCLEGLPVRVIRGAQGDPQHAPPYGYRYDGLYYVTSFWRAQGRSGHTIWRFHLTEAKDLNRETSTLARGSGLREMQADYDHPERDEVTIQRIVRSSDLVRQVKVWHDYHCQICAIRLETLAGPYAEGAHIHPLGQPHHGPDEVSNILCLCPNCHVRFDLGALVIDAGLTVRDSTTHQPLGRLRTDPRHVLSKEHLAYHHALFARPGPGTT